MKKEEKIIQIAYAKNDVNPTFLTSEGRVIRAVANGAYKQYICKDPLGGEDYNINSPVLVYQDVTPILSKIQKN